MTIPLRYDTASQEIPIGYCLDSTDGNTEETGLTIANTDIKIWKNGATTLANKNSGGATHISNGIYYAVLDATDTNTMGAMVVFVHVAGMLAERIECEVLSQNVYDSRYSTDYQQVDVIQLGSSTQSATDLKDLADDGYDPATNKIQGVVLCDTTTTNTDMVAAAPSAATVADAVWDEPVAGHVGAGTFGKTDADILADTDELQGDWANGGRLDLLLDACALEATVAALNDIAAADVWAVAMEGAVTAKEHLNVIRSAVAGKTSGGGTNTLVSRDAADTKARVTLTVDLNGNRTASVTDGS